MSAFEPAVALELFRDRCVHRRRSRALIRSLRSLLATESGRLPRRADFLAFLDRLHIPRQTACRLAFPQARALAPPPHPRDCDAVFCDQTLTLRLEPNHRAILELCAATLQREHAHLGYDFALIAASALHRHTRGLARQEIGAFLNYCQHTGVPDWCSHLPPVFIPTPPCLARRRPARPLSAAPCPSPSEIPTLWTALQHARRAQRLASRQLQPHLSAFAELLDRKHLELAQPGRSGAFHAWLKSHDIPRQSAYRLLVKFHKTRVLSCTKTESSRPPDLELLPCSARFRLSPLHSATVHRVLQDALQHPQPTDFSTLIASAFIEQLSPGAPAHSTALAWLTQPHAGFPSPRLFHPHPRYFSCRPGNTRQPGDALSAGGRPLPARPA